ncbi:hypothetical protein AQUCO_05600060v1 [Aquilegia coerulea]|uniref:Uncharacterized protein n=1 Tax=Aquilegia coerulea TaxID=218851 RepID=A0A2G5CGI6_AQUCA|nr:hypothetical protein AQUCO_05600060v1 [Aquilegia coerulea]
MSIHHHIFIPVFLCVGSKGGVVGPSDFMSKLYPTKRFLQPYSPTFSALKRSKCQLFGSSYHNKHSLYQATYVCNFFW